MKGETVIDFLKTTVSEWSEDKAPRLGAALAYYSIFSIGPVLVIAIAIAGLFFGAEGVQGQVHQTLQELIGPDGAQAIDTMVTHANRGGGGIIATVIGVVMLLFGASGVFAQLQDALNTIWEVQPDPKRGLWGTVRDRFLSLAMVFAVGFLLLVSLVVSAGLAALSHYMSAWLGGLGWLWWGLNLAVSFGIVTLLFAGMFKYLPDVYIRWTDVWVGALTTALLFTIGKFAIGLYLGNSSIGSIYGAAGSLVVLMLWVYYSAQVFFFGAEMTQVWANRYGHGIAPARGAVRVTPAERAQEGMPKEAAPRLHLGTTTAPPAPRRHPPKT